MATNLINFKQIKDGSLVVDAVKEWLTSGYPASKVYTKIVKTPAQVPTAEEKAAGKKPVDAVYYTVEELLGDLKKTTDAVLGDGEMSISQMIDAAKKEVQDELIKFKNQKVRDYVKMTGIIDHDGTVTLNDPIDRNSAAYQKEAMLGLHDGETLGVQDLDVSKAYALYYADNTPVRDKKGNNVTLTFKKTGNVDGIGTGLTEKVLATKVGEDGGPFTKYGSIVSDAPYIRDMMAHQESVKNVVVTRKKGEREIQLDHRNIVKGSLKVLHSHPYYAYFKGDDGGVKLVDQNTEHDASIDHYDINATSGAEVAKKNKEIGAPKTTFFFNAAAGRILFKQDVDDTFDISYDYETTHVVFTPDKKDGREIKLFPIGTYSLHKLNENFLLDNNELNLIAYDKALDEIIRKITEEASLTEHIAQVIGTTEVEKAIIARTEQMTQQAIDDKLELYNHDAELENAIRDVAYEVDQLATLHKNADKIDVLEVTVSEKDSDKPDGQTEFDLRKIPDKKPVHLWINGIRYVEKKHFAVNRTRTVLVGTNKQVTPAPQLIWTFTAANGGFNLVSEDELDIEAQYNVRTEIAPVIPIPYYTVQTMNDRAKERAAKEAAWKEAVELATKAGTIPPAKFEYMNDRPYNNDLIQPKIADDTYLQ